jgi:acylphosphatase
VPDLRFGGTCEDAFFCVLKSSYSSRDFAPQHAMTDTPATSTFRVRVEGFVQAVGYRNFTIEQAKKNGIDGWVRNRANGDVEMLVHGEENAVNAFITACTRGPEGSRVASIDLEKAEPPEEKGFRRRPSV